MELKRIIAFTKGPRKKIKIKTIRIKLENIISSIWIEWWNWKPIKLLHKSYGKLNDEIRKHKTFIFRCQETLHMPPKRYKRLLHTPGCAARSHPFLFFYLAKYKMSLRWLFNYKKTLIDLKLFFYYFKSILVVLLCIFIC